MRKWIQIADYSSDEKAINRILNGYRPLLTALTLDLYFRGSICYILPMRSCYITLVLLLLLSACGGHRFNTDDARKAIAGQPQSILEKEDIDVVYVTQTGKSSAIAETRVKTAFLLDKVDEKWVIREIRIGDGQWEKIENLTEALQRVKTEETRAYLDRIEAAVRGYQKESGRMPEFRDYIDLSDKLAPKNLDPLIRLDSWRRPLRATTIESNVIKIASAGPDGIFSTEDDISIAIAP